MIHTSKSEIKINRTSTKFRHDRFERKESINDNKMFTVSNPFYNL